MDKLWQGEVEGIERTQGRTEVLVDEGSIAVVLCHFSLLVYI